MENGNDTLINLSGGDACGSNTRSHPEHDGEDPCGRWYYIGDDMGEQAAARHFLIYVSGNACESNGLIAQQVRAHA